MTDSKITSLAAIGAAPDTADLLELVDVSDTSMAATGTNKKMLISNLYASPTLSGTATIATLAGACIGTNVQAWDADLDAFAGLTSGTNLIPTYTGTNTMATDTYINWGTWSGAWTALGPGNPAGAGTAVYQYMQLGKTVFCRFSLVLGISGTVGSNPLLTTPTTVDTGISVVHPLGNARLSSGGTAYAGAVVYNTTNNVAFKALNSGTTFAVYQNVTATAPGTWVAGDSFSAEFMYRAA